MRMSLVVFSGWRFLSTNSILSLTGLILENDNKEIWEIRRASIYHKFTIEDILRKIECLGYRVSRASGRPSVSMLTHPTCLSTKTLFYRFLTLIKMSYLHVFVWLQDSRTLDNSVTLTRAVFCPALLQIALHHQEPRRKTMVYSVHWIINDSRNYYFRVVHMT